MERSLERTLGLTPPPPPSRARELPSLEEIADRYVLSLLEIKPRNVAKTARILGISRTALYKRLRRLGF